MTERGTAGRWHRATWGLRARTLAFVVGGTIVAGAGIAYLRRRHRNCPNRNQPKYLQERGTSDATEKEGITHRRKDGHDVEEAGLAEPTAGVEERDSPAEKGSPEISSNSVMHVGWNLQPITVGLSSVALPLGTAPRESLLQQKRLDGNEIPSGAAAALVNQGLYLTSKGPNRDLLKIMKGEDAVGGFGEVTFWKTVSGQEFALKVAKDTAAGRRQQRREIDFLVDFKRLHPDAANIVDVAEARTAPFDMLLMRKEAMTLTGMLESAVRIDVVAVAKVLFGTLTAIDLLHESGFVQRDIKGDNILVGEDGTGVLADFGLCIATTDASLPEFLGDGTADYAAPEIASKLSGSTLCTELYSWFVVFVESVMMRHPFGGEQLLDARIDRLAYLEDKRTNLIEDANDTREELESLLGGEEDNAGEGGAEEEEGGGGGGEEEDEEEDEVSIFEQRLQLLEELARVTAELDAVRLQEWRLGVRSPSQGQPTDADMALLGSLGEPLSFFSSDEGETRDQQQREETVSSEAKADPARLFEGEDWVEWLPGPSMADCKQGVRLAVDFVVGEGAFHPDPGSRPQDVEAARELLTKAVALYEQERQREIELEQGDGATGATRRESGAGG